MDTANEPTETGSKPGSRPTTPSNEPTAAEINVEPKHETDTSNTYTSWQKLHQGVFPVHEQEACVFRSPNDKSTQPIVVIMSPDKTEWLRVGPKNIVGWEGFAGQRKQPTPARFVMVGLADEANIPTTKGFRLRLESQPLWLGKDDNLTTNDNKEAREITPSRGFTCGEFCKKIQFAFFFFCRRTLGNLSDFVTLAHVWAVAYLIARSACDWTIAAFSWEMVIIFGPGLLATILVRLARKVGEIVERKWCMSEAKASDIDQNQDVNTLTTEHLSLSEAKDLAKIVENNPNSELAFVLHHELHFTFGERAIMFVVQAGVCFLPAISVGLIIGLSQISCPATAESAHDITRTHTLSQSLEPFPLSHGGETDSDPTAAVIVRCIISWGAFAVGGNLLLAISSSKALGYPFWPFWFVDFIFRMVVMAGIGCLCFIGCRAGDVR